LERCFKKQDTEQEVTDLTEKIYKIGRVVIWILAGLALAWIVLSGYLIESGFNDFGGVR
jgi:hypothetical protein